MCWNTKVVALKQNIPKLKLALLTNEHILINLNSHIAQLKNSSCFYYFDPFTKYMYNDSNLCYNLVDVVQPRCLHFKIEKLPSGMNLQSM